MLQMMPKEKSAKVIERPRQGFELAKEGYPKNVAGKGIMQKSKLEKYKKSLIAARNEILQELEQEKESLEYNDQGDLVDIAEQMISNDILTRLSDMDLEKLKEIEHALSKIEDGTYGICEGTGKKIPEARLNHIPWTRYTMEYAEELERQKRF